MCVIHYYHLMISSPNFWSQHLPWNQRRHVHVLTLHCMNTDFPVITYFYKNSYWAEFTTSTKNIYTYVNCSYGMWADVLFLVLFTNFAQAIDLGLPWKITGAAFSIDSVSCAMWHSPHWGKSYGCCILHLHEDGKYIKSNLRAEKPSLLELHTLIQATHPYALYMYMQNIMGQAWASSECHKN